MEHQRERSEAVTSAARFSAYLASLPTPRSGADKKVGEPAPAALGNEPDSGLKERMALVARTVDLPPDAPLLARRLAQRPGAAWLWSADGSGPSYLASDPVGASEQLDPEPELTLHAPTSDLERVPRWIGALPYEARRDLERPGGAIGVELRPAPELERPCWRRYDAVAEVSGRGVRLVADDLSALVRLRRRLSVPDRAGPPVALRAAPPEPGERHQQRIRDALRLIAQGEIYQVNLARCFHFSVAGTPVDLLLHLSRRARARFAAALSLGSSAVVATSPELFLDLEPRGRLLTVPIKGTRPRGDDARSDRALAEELEQDPKERAELSMIIDVERNDLGRVATVGSVRLLGSPRVVTQPTVHHRLAAIRAGLRPGVSRQQLLEAMLPSGSVTGAPKVRAMEVIASLEAERRGLYTGSYGALCHDGSLRLAMAIRILTIQHGHGRYFAGGGIVADSDPAREVEETHWKAVQVLASH